MLNGYGGNILRINLTTGDISTQPTDPKLAEKWLGGRGFGAYFLFTELPKNADPLGPENILIISPGPLSGTLVPGAGKVDFTCKSPLTGGYASANSGGILTAEIKYAGYDSIILKGKAEKPVYILIDNEKVEIRDAADLWGKGSLETEKTIKDRLGEEFQVATIGPGGENGVKFACITTDYGRQAGRGGVGAVMGSKNVKAIAVRGNKGIPVADVKAFRKAARAMYKACKESSGLEVWQKYGTAGVTTWANEIGAFPTRNFTSGQLEGYENLSGQVMRDKIVITDKGCFGCPSPCGKWSHVKKYGVRVEGPEYESTAMLGGDCALTDIEDIAYANYLADHLGIDSISAGNAIAFAMECYERGILTDKDTGGLKLTFGNPEAVFTMLKQIAHKEGLGAVLAEGVKHASQVFGKGSDVFAIQAKGMEFSGYDTHNAPSMLLSYMTCDVGAHHNRSWAITYDIQAGRDTVAPDKAAKVISLQHTRPLFDALGACRLQWIELALDLNLYVPALAALTGLERSWDDLLKVSERIWNLTRLFWFREVSGFGRAWDMPPARFYTDPAVGGPTKGKIMAFEDVETLLDMYYEQRGWDSEGKPSPAKLAELDLAEFAKAV
jgi:aldehyde:ferredoxin oxidoreductase